MADLRLSLSPTPKTIVEMPLLATLTGPCTTKVQMTKSSDGGLEALGHVLEDLPVHLKMEKVKKRVGERFSESSQGAVCRCSKGRGVRRRLIGLACLRLCEQVED